MCGIAGGVDATPALVEAALDLIAHRGPDARRVRPVGSGAVGHVRLAIVDLDARSDQPFPCGDGWLAYNGELWNWRQLRVELEEAGRRFQTEGDTEVVAAALELWGDDALVRLNGMFALAWARPERTLLAVDRFGEVPLHVDPVAGVYASELKAMTALGGHPGRSSHVPPGSLVHLTAGQAPAVAHWHDQGCDPLPLDPADASTSLRSSLAGAVTERLLSDVPLCVLLSGGLDSAAVVALMAPQVPDLVAYTAVLDRRSPDLRWAREVADRTGVKLVEVEVQPPTADDLSRCVEVIEQPHKAQVEITWPCLALAGAMSSDGFRVTFSGEGSDELWASYGFAYHGVKAEGWHGYRRKLFLDQHRKNFARANKAFMSRSVECRLPFLNPTLVDLALSLPQASVVERGQPKAVLGRAMLDLLPAEVVRRPKLAFQDGLGLKPMCAEAVADPQRFYKAEFARLYGRR